MSDYAHPEALVSTAWAADHLNRSTIKFVEVNVVPGLYETGHIPGAIGWNWQTDLNDPVRRDVVGPQAFAELNRSAGIRPEDTVVLYGDNHNWFAAWAVWLFKYYRHGDVRLLDGGRAKWEREGRPFTAARPRRVPRSDYLTPVPDESIRAYRRDVEYVLGRYDVNLVDVRSPDEFAGRVNAPPGVAETSQRSGRIPGARNVPWAKTANDDGTFRPADELRALYAAAKVNDAEPTITYCRIGERSSHSWFVLRYLLGYPNVKNYDGSWTEWGNAIGTPIELDAGVAAAAAAGQPCVAG